MGNCMVHFCRLVAHKNIEVVGAPRGCFAFHVFCTAGAETEITYATRDTEGGVILCSATLETLLKGKIWYTFKGGEPELTPPDYTEYLFLFKCLAIAGDLRVCRE